MNLTMPLTSLFRKTNLTSASYKTFGGLVVYISWLIASQLWDYVNGDVQPALIYCLQESNM